MVLAAPRDVGVPLRGADPRFQYKDPERQSRSKRNRFLPSIELMKSDRKKSAGLGKHSSLVELSQYELVRPSHEVCKLYMTLFGREKDLEDETIDPKSFGSF